MNGKEGSLAASVEETSTAPKVDGFFKDKGLYKTVGDQMDYKKRHRCLLLIKKEEKSRKRKGEGKRKRIGRAKRTRERKSESGKEKND